MSKRFRVGDGRAPLQDVKRTTYYHDLVALHGQILTPRVAASIARAHGTSLETLESEYGWLLATGPDGETHYVPTARLAQALGYGE